MCVVFICLFGAYLSFVIQVFPSVWYSLAPCRKANEKLSEYRAFSMVTLLYVSHFIREGTSFGDKTPHCVSVEEGSHLTEQSWKGF